MKRFVIYGLFLFIILFQGCEKEEDISTPGESLDFYALSDWRTAENGYEIIDSSVELSDSIIIPYSEIESYNRKTYTFIVRDSISDQLNKVEDDPVHGTPFAVVVDEKMIYTGYFWAGYSSISCDWIVIDPLDYSGENKLKVALGYPAAFEDVPDKRNDERILEVLRQDNKLIE